MLIVKNCWGTTVPDGVGAGKPWSFSSACKHLSRQRPVGAERWSSEKVDLGGSKCISRTLLLVDKNSPDFFSLNAGCCRHISFQILDVSISSGVIRDQILKLTLI